MEYSNSRNWPSLQFISKVIFLFFAGFLVSHPAFAGSGDLPFNSTMSTLKDQILHQFLPAASIIMIVVTCLMLAFGEWGDGFKRIITIVLWLSVAFGAASFIGIFNS